MFPIHVPSLRERKDDIPLLAEYLVERYAKKTGKRITRIEKKTLDLFQSYDWPGNIRELQNVVERAVILSDGEDLTVEEAWLQRNQNVSSGRVTSGDGVLARGRKALANQERKVIEEAHGGMPWTCVWTARGGRQTWTPPSNTGLKDR